MNFSILNYTLRLRVAATAEQGTSMIKIHREFHLASRTKYFGRLGPTNGINFKRMKKSAFLCLLIGLLSSCENKDDNRSGIKQISYGASFGECIGYCKYEMILRSSFATFVQSGWNDTIETITCPESLTTEAWESFKNGFDPDEFFNLPETFGCPDCADGGAEWIEFAFFSGEKHKVTFEYMNEPEKLRNFVDKLRKYNSESTHCKED